MLPVDLVLITRFNAKWVKDPNSDCHLWTASTAGKGYGQIKIPGTRKQIYAHVLSYMIHKGEVPEGVQVRHSCDTPRCVNPGHLLLGSSADNHQDMVDRKRSTFGERNPRAKLTEEQVVEIRTLNAQDVPRTEIAERFGLHPMSVARIVRGDAWTHASGPLVEGKYRGRNLTKREVEQIRKVAAAGLPQTKVAELYGTTQGNVSRIMRKQRN